MKHRASLGLTVTLVLTVLLLVPAILQGQRTKPPNPPPPSAIPASIWLNSGAGNMIRAERDPDSPYTAILQPLEREGTTDKYDYYLSFSLRHSSDGLDAERSVVYDFGLPRYSSTDKLACYPTQYYAKDQAKVPYQFPVPAFLTTGTTAGGEKPLWADFQTSYEWVKVEQDDGAWAWQSTGRYLDLLPYVNGQAQTEPRYVEMYMSFRTTALFDQDAYAFIAHNGPVKTPSSWGSTRGLAEVTPAADGGIVLRPVSQAALDGSELPTASLYPWLELTWPTLPVANQANLIIKIPLGGARGFRAITGICDAGTFSMPYAMTVKKQ